MVYFTPMHLKSIELNGFKSFAKKSVLEFKSPITSVVGPNGSGKSNVAEAFRFVLGEQSMKSMRGKKGEDLIWNGSNDSPRANRAVVKVVFDNSDKLFNIDFPEVSVERVVNRDGSNEYSLNGSTVRLRDIFELLTSASLGSSGHHIISQGEADKVLNASPKERKSIIEDALGLKLYQYKRAESEKKLEKTRENIVQVELLRREIAPHLRFLKKQVEKVEKAETEKQTLILIAKQYFKQEDAYIKNERVKIASESAPVETALQDLAKEMIEAKAVLEKVAGEDKKQYMVLSLESEIAGERALKDGLMRELGKIEGALDAEERVIRRENELAQSEEHKMIKLKDVEELYAEVSTLTLLDKVIGRLKEFIQERKDVRDSSVIQEAEKRMTELKTKKLEIESKLSQIDTKEKILQERYESLRKEIDQDKDSSRDAEKAVFRIMSEESELLGKRKLLEARLERLNMQEAEFKRELEEVGYLVGAEVLRFAESVGSEGAPHIKDDRKREIQRLKMRLEDSGLGGSEEVLKEYKDTSERDEFLAKELLDLEKSASLLEELIKELGERLATEFASGIERINKEFETFFADMFGGGQARLTLIKQMNKKVGLGDLENGELEEVDVEAEEGLDISVSLPRKKIKGLMMLSGGERALTSIALVFAISQVNPPPFIILDETDAALDEANSRRYGDMVERLSKNSQLILITHNRETMSRAGMIYGVTMGSSGVSKLLSIDFAEAVQVAK
jgi:chromosome segregation protein